MPTSPLRDPFKTTRVSQQKILHPIIRRLQAQILKMSQLSMARSQGSKIFCADRVWRMAYSLSPLSIRVIPANSYHLWAHVCGKRCVLMPSDCICLSLEITTLQITVGVYSIYILHTALLLLLHLTRLDIWSLLHCLHILFASYPTGITCKINVFYSYFFLLFFIFSTLFMFINLVYLYAQSKRE